MQSAAVLLTAKFDNALVERLFLPLKYYAVSTFVVATVDTAASIAVLNLPPSPRTRSINYLDSAQKEQDNAEQVYSIFMRFCLITVPVS